MSVMRWPDEHLHWQGIINADETYSIPFATHLFIFHTREQMRAAVQDEQAAAHSHTYSEPDAAGIGAAIFFNTEDLYLSLVAHEATHVALAHYANTETTRVGAKRWLHQHPEGVAEMIGNLTAIVWDALCEHGGQHD